MKRAHEFLYFSRFGAWEYYMYNVLWTFNIQCHFKSPLCAFVNMTCNLKKVERGDLKFRTLEQQ